MAILHNHCGPDGFHYLIPFASPDVLGDHLEFEGEPDEDEGT